MAFASGFAAGAGARLGNQQLALQKQQLENSAQKALRDEAGARINSTFSTIGDVIKNYRDQEVSAGGINVYADAIASIESAGSGDYTAVGPVTRSGDRAYGRYQVMGANIPAWTKETFGEAMSIEEFVANPAAQDAVFQHKFNQYIEETGSPEDAASKWFTGRTLAEGGATATDGGLTGIEYVQKFSNAVKQAPTDKISKAIKPLMDDIKMLGQKAGIDTLGLERQLQALILATPSSIQKNLAEGRGKGQQKIGETQALQEAGISPEQAQSTAGISQPAAEPTTDDIKEYLFAQQNGYTGTFVEWQTKVKKAQTEININDAKDVAKEAFGKELGQEAGKDFVAMQNAAEATSTILGTLDSMETSLDSLVAAGGTTGAGSNAILTMKQLLQRAGVDVGDLSDEEVIRATGNQLALLMRNPEGGYGLTGNTSQRDLAFLQGSVPGLVTSVEGNKKLIEFMRRVAQRQIDIADMAAEYEAKNGVLDSGFYKERNKFIRENSLFTDADKKAVEGIKKTATTQPTSGAQKVRRYNPETGELE